MVALLEPNGQIVLSETVRVVRECDGEATFVRDPVWEGGPIARASAWHFRELRGALVGALVAIGPYRVRVIGRDEWDRATPIVARDGWRARLHQRAYPILDLCRMVKHRCIWTLGVWGLARLEPHTTTAWSDIHAVRWLRARLRRKE